MGAGMIIVEDVVTEDCVRRLHVMSDKPMQMDLPEDATVEQWVDIGVYHLRAVWPFSGMLDIHSEGWPKARRLYVQHFNGQRISELIRIAAGTFERAVGFAPGFAFVKVLPARAEWGQEVYGCLLFAAEWMPKNCVAVGGRR